MRVPRFGVILPPSEEPGGIAMDTVGAILRAGDGCSFPAKPFDVRVKVEAAETGDAFSLNENLLEPGLWPGPAPHTHPRSSETFCVLDSELEMLVGEEKIQAGTGTCVHVRPGVVHSFANHGTRPVRFLQILSPGSLLKMIEEVGAVLAASAGKPDPAKLAGTFAKHDFHVVERAHA